MRAPRIALVAGETSGDQLGQALIAALRERSPGAQFCGVAGPLMRSAGCEALAAADELAVMGFVEPLAHLPRLWRLRRMLLRRLIEWRPDVFVGIDAPGFNLGLAAQFKAAGVKTVQYVSPQVWAWRQGRVRTIARDCDLVLCLLPFEPAFYAAHEVKALFVGHPLADQIPLDPGRGAARLALGLDPGVRVVALLPGSRRGEVQRLGAPYMQAAKWLQSRRPELQFLAPMASAAARTLFEAHGAAAAGIRLLDGQARTVLQAADAALVTSGTATLEALLCGCPMVVAYKAAPLSALLVRAMIRVPYFSLPNLLAGERLVPEFFQQQVRGAALGAALLAELEDAPRSELLRVRFRAIHATLAQAGAGRAADGILQLLGPPGALKVPA
ncbi:MAG TPA: lipid-A-disaccharide synthase [Steroidobacteraceae bacterium]